MIDVRPAAPADAADVAHLARLTHALHAAALPRVFQAPGPDVVRTDDVERLIAHPQRLLLVATLDGAFAGFAHAEVEHVPASAIKRADAVLHVHELAVLPALRRRGVARALLRAVRETAVAHGLATVTLDVYAFNADALALYAREGFAPLRTRLVAPASPAP